MSIKKKVVQLDINNVEYFPNHYEEVTCDTSLRIELDGKKREKVIQFIYEEIVHNIIINSIIPFF